MAKVRIKKDRCKGCGLCVLYCPVKHLEMSEDLNCRGVPYAREKEGSACTGCGLCFMICPECCIEIPVREEKKDAKDQKKQT